MASEADDVRRATLSITQSWLLSWPRTPNADTSADRGNLGNTYIYIYINMICVCVYIYIPKQAPITTAF